MIHVDMPSEPENFHIRVKSPGYEFLQQVPNPSSRQWRAHSYWRRVLKEFYEQLNGICMYCATYTPYAQEDAGITQVSIDHFVPKSIGDHYHAYHWDNFRMCRIRLNHLKENAVDIVDPYLIANGDFTLDFTTFLLSPNPNLDAQMRRSIQASIDVLRLNKDSAYVNERTRAVYHYVAKNISWEDFKKKYPFIAYEMVSQDFERAIRPIFESVIANPQIRATLVKQKILDQ